MQLIWPFIFLFRLFLSEHVPGNSTIKNYDLNKPDTIIVLPPALNEISGITLIDSLTLACVQDENGIIFTYDLSKKRLGKQYAFHINGDYEEIVRVKNTLYILRSDGVIFEVFNYSRPGFKVKSYFTGIPSKNNEGLCYDERSNRLLISCKGKVINVPSGNRMIYAFDLQTKKLSDFPVFQFNVESLKAFALKENIQLPQKSVKPRDKKSETVDVTLKFRPSAMTIHPIDKSLYILSAADDCLFIFSGEGAIEHIEKLDPTLFNKPEGIVFFQNGDMIISNEADGKKPTLLRFNYRK
jgi:hypothetical protein